MNKIYKVIWSKVRNCYVAVSEIAKRNGKSCTSVNCVKKVNCGRAGLALSSIVGATLLAGVCSVLLPVRVALAATLPTLDYKGASAYVTIDKATANTMAISSTKTNNVLKWIDFSIGSGGTVQFDPNNYLNYVTGHGRSEIDGILKQTKNELGNRGNIYIVNPNGVLFGDNARVDVGNLYISTRELGADQFSEFEDGNNPLTSGDIKGDVVNLGKLNATNITVEGNNISFKNVADITKGGTLTDNEITGGTAHNDSSVTLTANSTGEIHIGSIAGGELPDYAMSGTDKRYMYKLVSTPAELQAIGEETNLSGNYMLASDINASGYPDFTPIGDDTNRFTGKFDGLKYEIQNLSINQPSMDYVGLFGYNAGTIENVGITGGSVIGRMNVGGISGYNVGTIRNVYNMCDVSSGNIVTNLGGIAGDNYGTIQNVYNTGNIISNGGTSSGGVSVGGIAGRTVGSSIQIAYNTGNISSTRTPSWCGGIVGMMGNSSISDVYNTGSVKGTCAGGIVGSDYNIYSGKSTISRSYNMNNDISKANGEVTSSSGAILGKVYQNVAITSSYFAFGPDNGYGTKITEAELHDINIYDGWSISTEGGSGATWRLYQGVNGSDTNNRPTPLLTAFLKPKDLVQVYEYDGNEHMFRKDDPLLENDTNIKHSGVAYPNWKPISLKDAGVDDFSSENGLFDKKVFYSLQNGYDIADMKLIIQPKRVTATFDSNTYNGTAVFTGVSGTLSNVETADVENVTVTATATYNDKNAGAGKSVSYSDIALDGTKKDNYVIVDSLTGTGTIIPAPVTISVNDYTRAYDGTTDASGATLVITNGTSDALFGADTASGGTKTFDTKNVVEGKNTITLSDVTITDGNEGKNYAVTYAQNTNSKITPANLTLTAEDVTKTYDGTTSVTGGTLKVKSGTLYTEQGDSMSGGTFAFTNKNVGTGNKVVTVTDATISDGNGGENYNVTYENNTTSTIMTKALSVGNVTKEYDGNATASLTVSNLLGVEECDKTGLSISAGVVANYTNNTGDKDANAGTGKRVEYTGLTLSGAEAGNYTIAASGTSTTGNSITARALTMGSVSKVYDGTNNALVSVYALTNAIEDDLLDLSFKGTSSGKYSGKNVGDNLTVTYTGLILEGAKAGNYTIDSDAAVTGNSITPKELTLVADKVTIKNGEAVPTSFTGNVIGFVGEEGLASQDDLKFELATPGATMAGSYAVIGMLKDSESGDYQANGVYSTDNTFKNYTFSNSPTNGKAFTIAVDVMPQLDYRGASADVTIDSATTANTMAISSIQLNNVLKWIDFSIGSGGTVQFDENNYLNYVTGHGRSEINGTLKGGGAIYLINPNGMLFGSDAQVNVGNLYLSSRSLAQSELDAFTVSGTNPFGTTVTAAVGDIANLGTLKAANITVEGNNVSFKNYADITATNNINVRASGEVHVGFANDATAATAINSTEYTTVNEPDLTNWNFKGLDNSTNVTPVKYMLVRNPYELQNINNNLTGNYMLANDIDFIDKNGNWIIRYFKSLGSKGNNWGSRPGMFQGRLDGLNHVIRNINITNTKNESYSTDVGIIGSNAGIVENFGVVNGNIVLSSKSWVGGIVGANKGCGIIRNVYFSGLVEGNRNVGGIAGAQDGYNTQEGVDLPGGRIEKAYASGTVRSNSSNGGSNVGGIAGSNASGARISEAYNSANVSTKAGGNYIGGIAGTNSGTIINAYNTGTIEGGTYVGGIAGSNSSNGSIQNTYNTGTVSGTSDTSITGSIAGSGADNSVSSSYFTVNYGNDIGKLINESELKKFDTFAGSSLAASKRWDMFKTGGAGTVWRIYEGQTGPLLTAFLKTKDVVTATEYNGEEQAFDNTLAQGIANHIYATDSGNLVKGTDAGKYFGNNTDNNNSGYKVYYSDQGGYDIGDTILVIQPKKVAMNSISNVYDGNVDAIIAVTDLGGVLGTDTSGLTISATSAKFADKNVGENKVVTYSGLTLSGTKAKNYIIAPSATGTGKITKREISVAFGDISKTYDGLTTSDTIGARTFTNVIAADADKVDVTATATYDEKNAGNRTVDYSAIALTGDEANNYSLTHTTASSTGTINKRETGVSFGAISKTYDGLTTSDTIGARTFTNVIAADADKVDVTATATYNEKNVGNRTVDYSAIALTGDEANNYSLTNTTASSTGTINKRETGVSFGAISKTYDGLTASDTIGARTFTNVIAADADKVDVTATATYDKKNAGNRTVDYSAIALTGVEANNYSLTNTTASGTGTIDKKSVTATFADISKIYDGTTNATPGAGTLTGVIAADEGKVNVSATDASYDEKNAGNRTVNYTGVTLSGAEAGNYSIATTATGNGTIGRKALELVADPASTEYGDYNPASFTGRVDGFVAGESVSNGDSLQFALSDPSASAVGSYGITGTINGSSSGDYGLNYTFTNAASNANAFTIYARPASVQDMVLSDIIPGIKGMTGADISVTSLDNSLEQATDKKAEVGIEFAVAQTILSVDADRNLSLENRGMKQLPAMTPQEVAEQVHAQQGKGNGVAAQAGGNAGAASGGTNENGAASNAGVTGAVNAAMDVVQQTDDAVGTEESKRKKGVA